MHTHWHTVFALMSLLIYKNFHANIACFVHFHQLWCKFGVIACWNSQMCPSSKCLDDGLSLCWRILRQSAFFIIPSTLCTRTSGSKTALCETAWCYHHVLANRCSVLGVEYLIFTHLYRILLVIIAKQHNFCHLTSFFLSPCVQLETFAELESIDSGAGASLLDGSL